MWRVRRDRQKPYRRTNVWNKEVDWAWFKTHSAVCMGVLAFFLPVWITFVTFYASAIYPFGEDTFARIDLFLQYIPFFTEYTRQLKAGQGIAYTWNLGMGSNMLELYGYYLSSPFYWLGALIPEQYHVEFVSWLVLPKMGLCGLFSYIFLCTRPGRMYPDAAGGALSESAAALFFSLGYALSGYLAAYNWNVMWIESVALLPLILMGLEKLVVERKPLLYCLALATSIWCNFYLSILICIFLVLYFICLFIEHRKIGILLDFILYSLLAGGIAAALLLPEICALFGAEISGGVKEERIGSYFTVLDTFARHCVFVAPELSGGTDTDYWPNVYCGVCAFLGMPLYAVNGRIPLRKRMIMLALWGFLLMSFQTPILDLVWHVMNYPHGLPAREAFLYIMLVLMLCQEGILRMDFSDMRQGRKIFLVYLAVLAGLLYFEKCMIREEVSAGAVWCSILFVTMYAVLLYLLFTRQRARIRVILVTVAILVMTLEVHSNTQVTSVIAKDREDYFANIEEYQTLYRRSRERDPEFYRLEVLGSRLATDNVRAGIPTVSSYSSTTNALETNFLTRLGLHGGKHFHTFSGGSTAFTTSLLNIKYMLCNNSSFQNRLYTEVDQQDGTVLLQNRYVLPFGYVAPTGWDFDAEGAETGIDVQNALCTELGVQEPLFILCGADASDESVSFTADEDGIYYGVLVDGEIFYNMTMAGYLRQQI
ncbi:MAG: YfhO family protein [Lachnospiraceae bacterium]|nr:YfhO family protein [Lachnospiraceae bacterium]